MTLTSALPATEEGRQGLLRQEGSSAGPHRCRPA